MRIHKVDREKSGLFSAQQIVLSDRQEQLEELITAPFSEENLVLQASLKAVEFDSNKRKVLQEALLRQYDGVAVTDLTKKNLDSLTDENTFTVTTGHQLSLFTGPLYFVVKILHVIRLAEEMKRKHPEMNVVPVYWMATEDHDFEEIQSMSLFGKALTHNYGQRGPVGRFSVEQLETFKKELIEFFGEDKRAELEILLNVYKGDNLAQATRNLVNALFGEYGLVIVDGDDRALKAQFAPLMQKELEEGFSEKAVMKANAILEKKGFAHQIFARPINLFYLDDQSRERIIEDGDQFVAGGKSGNKDAWLQELKEIPENFSPNVVLRPLYQEVILPNLAYVGGYGEIAYWTQLKPVFEEAGILYPLIQVRNSVVWIDKGTSKKMNSVNLSVEDIFESADQLKRKFVEENSGDEMDFTDFDDQFKKLSDILRYKVLSSDKALETYAHAEITRMEKQIDGVKGKILKASKNKHDQSMAAIDFIKERVFPGNGLQERKYNLLHFCADGQIREKLKTFFEAIDPWEKRLIVIEDVNQ